MASTPKTPLTLNKIFAEEYYAPEKAQYFRWLDDGSGYTVLEPREADSAQQDERQDDTTDEQRFTDIVFYNVDGTGRKVLVAYEELLPKNATNPLVIDDYTWSSDGQWALIYANSKRVWRTNTRGEYFLLNLSSKALHHIGPTSVQEAFAAHVATDAETEGSEASTHAELSQLMFAKFSPDSKKVAYVYKNNIYYQHVGNDEVHQLTSDGDDIIINGNFDWVYEEELSIQDGFRWSPDSEKIGYWQLDTSGVKDFILINNTDGLYPTLHKFPYPKAGETNSAVKVGIVNLADKQTQWIAMDGDPRDRYIPRINWAGPDSLLVQDVDRPQQVNKLWLYDWVNNTKELIYTETDDAFLEYYYDALFLENEDYFIWHSERDGWRHLFKIAKDGSEVISLTPGEFDIVEMLAFNEDDNAIYFTASPDNPNQRYMYKSTLDGEGVIERVTPEAFSGDNSYYLSKDASNALHHHSSFATPRFSQTIKVEKHSTVRTLVKNEQLKQRLEETRLPDHEFITVNATDGTPLEAYVMTPKNLDKNKQYPVIFYVYGEPAASTVRDIWGDSRYLFPAYLVEQGFIVVSVDNRGTRTPKGRDWRKSIYKKIGTITAQDQVDALDQIAQRYPFIDTSRVGVWGHSGGGSSTLSLLFKHADKFHAGIAVAPVPDIRLYDTIYQERYSGHPETDPESYYNTSSINFVEGFKGKLLLIHGTGDDNVHYQGAEKLINELVKYNKQFEFMSYPNRAHGVREGEGTLLHRFTLMADFFERHLKN